MTGLSRGCRYSLIGAAIAAAALVFALCMMVFLVLTGIIAEPETVIEHIVRTLLGYS